LPLDPRAKTERNVLPQAVVIPDLILRRSSPQVIHLASGGALDSLGQQYNPAFGEGYLSL